MADSLAGDERARNSPYGPGLLPQHAALLTGSGISPDVAQARGYRSVETRAELRRLGFGDAQARTPALLIPIYNVTGERAFYQLRPDEPRMVDGKLVKYETPRGARMALDVPPAIRGKLGDRSVPLFVTEGVRKADAAVSKDLCCVALLGVWNWRGTNPLGGKVALPDFELVALNEREVYVVFDSDVMVKPEVHSALARLKDLLASRGADVRLVYLPPGDGGAKVGLDDFFAAGGTVPALLGLATRGLRRPAVDRDDGGLPYRETCRGLVHLKPTRDGAVEALLTNFSARIVADLVEDDGTDDDARRVLEVEARSQGRTIRFTVGASRFAGMGWVTEYLGPEALVYPGMTTKDHARVAIQMLSTGIMKRRVYTHTGWRMIDAEPVYLHGGGAIGTAGALPTIQVRLPAALTAFALPEPPEGEHLVAAVRASLRLADLGPARVTIPLYAALCRAVMRPADFSVHVVGPTGVFKTEIAALVQAHWGRDLSARNLPGAWSGTANSLEALAFTAKDAVLVVDDFAPSGTTQDVARAHREADRLLRAQGNRAGRQRMRADTTLRPPKPPRGLILSTGEDAPRGQSLRARVLLLELGPGEVDIGALTACQQDAAAGRYAEALAGYVRWLTAHYNQVRATWATDLALLRAAATRSDAHRRTPEIIAQLALGYGWFALFGYEIGALTVDEAEQHWHDTWAALGEAAASQTEHQATTEPSRRFLDLLAAAVASGKAHVAGVDGSKPQNAQAWGWRQRPISGGDFERIECHALGDRLGWTDGEALYLQADASYAVAQQFARVGGDALNVTLPTLKKRLREQRLLVSTETRGGKLRFEVRRSLDGRRRAVLHLAATSLGGEEVAQVAQAAETPNGGAGRLWATLWATRVAGVAQRVAPEKRRGNEVPPPDGPPGPPPHAGDGVGEEWSEWSAS